MITQALHKLVNGVPRITMNTPGSHCTVAVISVHITALLKPHRALRFKAVLTNKKKYISRHACEDFVLKNHQKEIYNPSKKKKQRGVICSNRAAC